MLRGAGLALCCATLGVAAHAAAGGELPAFGPTALLTVVLAGAGVALADRRRGLPAILAIVGGAQVGLHVLLDSLAHHAPAESLTVSPASGPVVMTGLHAAAALVMALLLAGAERSAFVLGAVLDWLLGAVPVRPFTPPAWAAAVAKPVAVVSSGELRLLLRRVHGRRGPPVLL